MPRLQSLIWLILLTDSLTRAVLAQSPMTPAAKIAELRDRFGLRSITGDAVDLENLEILDRAYSRLPVRAFKNLDVVLLKGEDRINVKKTDDEGNVTIGKWEGLDGDGHPVEPTQPMVEMHGGRITHFIIGRLKFWGAIHEVTHHLTIYVDPAFGRSLIESLNYSYAMSTALRGVVMKHMTPERQRRYSDYPSADPVSPQRDMDLCSWRSGREDRPVRDHWYPTSYSRKSAREHAAEVITAFLASDTPNPTDPIRSEYNLEDNPTAMTLLNENLRWTLPLIGITARVTETPPDSSSGSRTVQPESLTELSSTVDAALGFAE